MSATMDDSTEFADTTSGRRRAFEVRRSVRRGVSKKRIISKSCYAAAFGISFASRFIGGLFSKKSEPSDPAQASSPSEEQTEIRAATTTSQKTVPPSTTRFAQSLSKLTLLEKISRSLASAFNRGRDWIRSRLTLWSERLKELIKTLSARRDGVWEYALVTIAYWGLTITDGAIRMLVLFQFYLMGYSAFQIASLFLFYEIFGVITNLFGGWIGANLGLRVTLFGGLALQIFALVMLAFMSPSWPAGIVIAYVMVNQALSGIAKDLTKMSSKSAIKAVVPKDADAMLYRWVSLLTGSKNALKGVGFFVGALLLTITGFNLSLLIMGAGLFFLLQALWRHLPADLGRTKEKAKFKSMFALDRRINILSAARFFLFGARDVWFVVALPVYLSSFFGWSPIVVGAYLALWTIGYGIVQSLAPRFIAAKAGETPKGYTVLFWAGVLTAVPIAIALAIGAGIFPGVSIVGGLAIFAVIFAINSAVHSYMIVYYAESEKVAMTVGFYYMANAGGRLVGTVLSGWVYQVTGIVGCLWLSGLFSGAAALISAALALPEKRKALQAGTQPAGLLPAYTG
jgi:hypothetical protein